MKFKFNLQLFAETVINGLQDKEMEVKPGDTVKMTRFNMKISNHSKASFHFEAYQGIPNVVRWNGNPGKGGYIELVALIPKGGTSATTRYESLNDEGTLIQKTTTDREKTTTSVGKVVKEDNNQNNILGLLYSDNKTILNGPRTKITDLDFSKKGISAAYYSLAITPKDNGHGGEANDSTKVTVDSVKEDSKDPGLQGTVIWNKDEPYFVARLKQAYLKVTATTTSAGTSLQVNVMGVMPTNGALVKSPEKWNGTFTLSGVKDKSATTYAEKYTVLKYSKPVKAQWHFKVTDVAIGSVFTGYNGNDVIETAATGDTAYKLNKGSYNLYHTVKNSDSAAKYENTIQVRNVAVVGSADVKVKDGQISWLGNFSKGSKVTLKYNKDVVSYELKKDSYWKTETINGKKISYKTAADKVTDVLTVKDEAWSLAGGTETLSNTDSIKVGDTYITAAGSDIIVTANGDKYTIGSIKEGDSFKVADKTYTRYGNALFNGEGKKRRKLIIGAGKMRVATSAQITTDKLWKTAVEADNNYVAENITLAQVDTLAAKNVRKKVDIPETMSFVRDRFVIEGTKKAARNTTLAADYNKDFQHEAGKVNTKSKIYDAVNAVAGQNIKAASGWTVNAGKYNDTITGAAAVRGKDEYATYNAGAGTNTINLGTAKEKVIVGTEDSYDTIKGYASGKDKILIGEEGKGNFNYLVKGADLYLTNDQESLASVDEHQHALLKGAAVSTRAVNINGENYYFGGVKVNVDKKTKEVTATNAQSNTFNYNASDNTAHYIGSSTTTASEYNDLAVNKPKAKRGGLDTLKVQETAAASQVSIDLTDASKYVSIDAVDASGMKAAKGVKAAQYGEYKGASVKASDTGLRFTGSKFADTVTCGTGHDYIITGMKQGADKVNNFGIDDIIQVNGLNAKVISSWKKDGTIDADGNLTKDTLSLGTGSLSINAADGVKLHVEGNKIKGSKA